MSVQSVGNSRFVPVNAGLAVSLRDYGRQVLVRMPVVVPIAGFLIRRTFDRTVLGLWLILLRAVLPAVTLALVFPHFQTFQTPGLPYPAFLFAGMSLWVLVDVGVGQGIRCLYHARAIRRFVTVPSFLVVLASLGVPLLNFAVLVIGTGIAIAVTQAPLVLNWSLLAVPIAIVLVLMLVSGLSAVLSVAFMLTRDVRFVAPVLTHVSLFATPIFYPLSALPPGWQTVSLYLNPLTPLVEATRFCLFGVGTFHAIPLLVSTAVICIGFLIGMWFAMRSEWALPEMT